MRISFLPLQWIFIFANVYLCYTLPSPICACTYFGKVSMIAGGVFVVMTLKWGSFWSTSKSRSCLALPFWSTLSFLLETWVLGSELNQSLESSSAALFSCSFHCHALHFAQLCTSLEAGFPAHPRPCQLSSMFLGTGITRTPMGPDFYSGVVWRTSATHNISMYTSVTEQEVTEAVYCHVKLWRIVWRSELGWQDEWMYVWDKQIKYCC
jgi:hypothetical protein